MNLDDSPSTVKDSKKRKRASGSYAIEGAAAEVVYEQSFSRAHQVMAEKLFRLPQGLGRKLCIAVNHVADKKIATNKRDAKDGPTFKQPAYLSTTESIHNITKFIMSEETTAAQRIELSKRFPFYAPDVESLRDMCIVAKLPGAIKMDAATICKRRVEKDTARIGTKKLNETKRQALEDEMIATEERGIFDHYHAWISNKEAEDFMSVADALHMFPLIPTHIQLREKRDSEWIECRFLLPSYTGFPEIIAEGFSKYRATISRLADVRIQCPISTLVKNCIPYDDSGWHAMFSHLGLPTPERSLFAHMPDTGYTTVSFAHVLKRQQSSTDIARSLCTLANICTGGNIGFRAHTRRLIDIQDTLGKHKAPRTQFLNSPLVKDHSTKSIDPILAAAFMDDFREWSAPKRQAGEINEMLPFVEWTMRATLLADACSTILGLTHPMTGILARCAGACRITCYNLKSFPRMRTGVIGDRASLCMIGAPGHMPDWELFETHCAEMHATLGPHLVLVKETRGKTSPGCLKPPPLSLATSMLALADRMSCMAGLVTGIFTKRIVGMFLLHISSLRRKDGAPIVGRTPKWSGVGSVHSQVAAGLFRFMPWQSCSSWRNAARCSASIDGYLSNVRRTSKKKQRLMA